MFKIGRDGFEWFDPKKIEIVQFDSKDVKDKSKVFRNPRTVINPGFSPEKMAELRGAIAKDGLKQPLEVRKVGDSIKLVAGERRLRSIRQLLMNDDLCYNPNTRSMERASKVYKEVCCKVVDCQDDKDALRHAIMENLLHEHLTDHELLVLCHRLEEADYTRAEQAEIFSKSEAWISQSHSLLDCHSLIAEYMSKGVLGRTQALQFLQIPRDKVEEVLKHAMADSLTQAEAKEAEALKEQEKAFENLEQHESELRVVQIRGKNSDVSDVRKKIAQDQKDIDKTERKVEQARKSRRRSKLTVENVQAGAKLANTDIQTRAQSIKIIRSIHSDLSGLLTKNEVLVNPDNGTEYNSRDIRIVVGVLEWVLNSNDMKTPLDVLVQLDAKDAAK